MSRASDTDTAPRPANEREAPQDAAREAHAAREPIGDAAAPLDVAHASRERLQSEVVELRKRLTQLERELVDVQTEANAAVAQWQERAYWLDRWHLDLNALMERPGAAQLRGLLRAIRSVVRFFKHAKRRLRS